MRKKQFNLFSIIFLLVVTLLLSLFVSRQNGVEAQADGHVQFKYDAYLKSDWDKKNYTKLTSAPAIGTDIVISVTATSNTNVSAISVSIPRYGIGGVDITSSNYINNGIGVTDILGLKIFQDDGAHFDNFVIGWIAAADEYIPKNTTINVGAFHFETTSTEIEVAFTKNGNTTFVGDNINYSGFSNPDNVSDTPLKLTSTTSNNNRIRNMSVTNDSSYRAYFKDGYDYGRIGGRTDLTVVVGYDATKLSLTPRFDEGLSADILINNNYEPLTSGVAREIDVNMGQFDIRVIAPNQTQKKYRITIEKYDYRLDIGNMHLISDYTQSSKPTLDGDTYRFPHQLLFKEKSFLLKVFPRIEENEVYYLDGNNKTLISSDGIMLNFKNDVVTEMEEEFKISVKHESGIEKIYKVVVERKAANTDATLSNVKIKVNDDSVVINSFDRTNQQIKLLEQTPLVEADGEWCVPSIINNKFSKFLTIDATPTASNAKVYIDNVERTNYQEAFLYDEVTFDLRVEAESYALDKTAYKTFSVTIKRTPTDVSDESLKIKNITVLGYQYENGSFNKNKYEYLVDIPNPDVDKANIIITKNGHDLDVTNGSKIAENNSNVTYQVDLVNKGDELNTIYIESKDGNQRVYYIIHIRRAENVSSIELYQQYNLKKDSVRFIGIVTAKKELKDVSLSIIIGDEVKKYPSEANPAKPTVCTKIVSTKEVYTASVGGVDYSFDSKADVYYVVFVIKLADEDIEKAVNEGLTIKGLLEVDEKSKETKGFKIEAKAEQK
ncbi:MAG: cadherin-like beta sandwich domain-containing protein [Acholeplasmatales bacterium]|nr:cadherin-like beta sandwich domain-containing protein [Acholeplasmatales bacterium]